ncbi:MAG TPA: hypothetical protein VGO87_00750 [Acidimicrobiia bacterium]|jgi:hypothetical protein
MPRRLVGGLAAITLTLVLLPTAPASAATCSGPPLANVWQPSRLHVLAACKTVRGRVTKVQREPDGDSHIEVRLDPGQASLLNAANRSKLHGNLMLEIVPADQPGCVAGHKVKFGVCSGRHLATPKVGAQVTASGPYVVDTLHGWREIHPVKSLSIG